jgi:hypothetical protein
MTTRFFNISGVTAFDQEMGTKGKIALTLEFNDVQMREQVKARGYRWNSLAKSWDKTCDGDAMTAEIAFLQENGGVALIGRWSDVCIDDMLAVAPGSLRVAVDPMSLQNTQDARIVERFDISRVWAGAVVSR